MITASPPQVHLDATSLITFNGAAGLSVEWALTGAGTLAAIENVTDSRGAAHALFTPGAVGDVTITVSYGA